VGVREGSQVGVLVGVTLGKVIIILGVSSASISSTGAGPARQPASTSTAISTKNEKGFLLFIPSNSLAWEPASDHPSIPSPL